MSPAPWLPPDPSPTDPHTSRVLRLIEILGWGRPALEVMKLLTPQWSCLL